MFDSSVSSDPCVLSNGVSLSQHGLQDSVIQYDDTRICHEGERLSTKKQFTGII